MKDSSQKDSKECLHTKILHDVLSTANKIVGKVQFIKERLRLFENLVTFLGNVKSKNNEDLDMAKGEQGSRNSMEILTDLLADAHIKFEKGDKAKRTGYHITY